MKIALIVLGVFLFLTFLAGLIGFFVKKQEKVIKKQVRDAQMRIVKGKKAYKGAKKRYGKVPAIK
jgi:uncharacterized protein YneF (UPF0154 family)